MDAPRRRRALGPRSRDMKLAKGEEDPRSGGSPLAGLRRSRRLRLQLDRQRRTRRPDLRLGRHQRPRHGPARRRRPQLLAARPGLHLHVLRHDYSQLSICSNGWISLDRDGQQRTPTSAIPSAERAQHPDRPVLGRPEPHQRRHACTTTPMPRTTASSWSGTASMRYNPHGLRDLRGDPQRRRLDRLPVQDDGRHAELHRRHRERGRHRRPAGRLQRRLRPRRPGRHDQLRAAAGAVADPRRYRRDGARPARPEPRSRSASTRPTRPRACTPAASWSRPTIPVTPRS